MQAGATPPSEPPLSNSPAVSKPAAETDVRRDPAAGSVAAGEMASTKEETAGEVPDIREESTKEAVAGSSEEAGAQVRAEKGEKQAKGRTVRSAPITGGQERSGAGTLSTRARIVVACGGSLLSAIAITIVAVALRHMRPGSGGS